MTIGAIGAYSFQPYVYNTNTVSAASMNKLSKISDDVLDRKVDYSGLTEEAQNENPLKKGQTIDFQGMLERQMQKGYQNAARVMKPADETQNAQNTVQAAEDAVKTAQAAYADEAKQVETAQSVAAVSEDASAGSTGGFGSYQMQQAISAYTAFDIAV
jgi:hypothetical protein